MVTQLKGNVMLVIASHNVNHLHGVAPSESNDRVICGIKVTPYLSLPVLLMLSLQIDVVRPLKSLVVKHPVT